MSRLKEPNAVRQLKAKGMCATDIADRLGIARASVYRLLDEEKIKTTSSGATRKRGRARK